MKAFILPDEQIMSVDGLALECSFTMDANIKAVNWNNGKGVIQYKDDTPNLAISSLQEIPDYDALITVYDDARIAFIDAKKLNPPSEYHTWNDQTEEFEITPENLAIKEAEEQATAIRRAEFEAEAADMKGATMDEVVTYINLRLDGTTLDTATKTELRRIFKKFAAFLGI